MKKKVLLFARRSRSAAREALRELAEWLRSRQIEALDVTNTGEKLTEASLQNVVLGVIIGGDGTLLTLVRRLEKKDQFPLMGVNCGTLGFITEVDRNDMLPAVGEFFENKHEEESRGLLSVELWRRGECVESGFVFNDAVITKDARTTMLKFDVRVAGEHLSYVKSDGYIVSTPTGSTAYNLSAGGPMLHPMVDGMILSAICSHSLSARPIVIPSSMEVEIIPREFKGNVYLVYDGQIDTEIAREDRIRIRTSGTSLRLIRSAKHRWQEALRCKLSME